MPPALRELVAELRPLLVELTGPVVLRHLEQVRELRDLTANSGAEVSVLKPRALERLTTGNAAFDRILGGGSRSGPSA